MTREIAHLQSFEKALYSISANFPPGKLPGDPRFTNTYFNLSQGEGDLTGSWNSPENFDVVSEFQDAHSIDGDGQADTGLTEKQRLAVSAMATRTASDPNINPTTGAELGSAGAQPDPDGKTPASRRSGTLRS